MKKKLIIGFSILITMFILINLVGIATFDVRSISSINIVIKPDKVNLLSMNNNKKPESTLHYIDSIKSIINSKIPIYFYELPYSYNLAYSKREYPGTRHTNPFFSCNKTSWEASFIDNKENYYLISEKSYTYGNNSFDNKKVALNDNVFQYNCDYFVLEVEFKRLSFLDRANWFLSSEYGI